MMRRMPLAVLALVLATALGACAAIPTSGGVQTGGTIDTETQVQGVFQPAGPQTNSSPTTIVTDFIQAALDPQDDYATARKFLTGNQQQKWNPNANVTVQQGTGSARLGADGRVVYTTTAVATIDATGVYTQQQAGPFDPSFTLVQVEIDGSKQWRIKSLLPGIVISESTFGGVFGAYPLYFFAPGYKYLVPDVRWFPTTDSVATRIASALLAGPTGWLGSPVLVTSFPPGTALDDAGVAVDSAVATVALSAEAKQNMSATDRARMQQQMTASLTTVSNVRSVSLTVGGVAIAPSVGGSAPIVQPSVNPATLVQQSGSLGFVTDTGVSAITGISSKAKSLGLVGATYTDTSSVLAGRTAGGVALVKANADPVIVSTKATSVTPTLDPAGFVWYLAGNRLSTLSSYGSGVSSMVDTSSLGAGQDAHVVSMDVSRDGTRLLLYLQSDSIAHLEVVGIIRDSDNKPIKLGPDPVSFPVSQDRPIDATWESDRAVAALSGDGSVGSITEFAIGGPSADLGTVADATQIVGGNGGETGLRVLDSSGVVHRPSGAGTSWSAAGFTASFLVTQQPG